MKKKISYWLFCGAIFAAAAVLFASCDKKEKNEPSSPTKETEESSSPILGTWTMVRDEGFLKTGVRIVTIDYEAQQMILYDESGKVIQTNPIVVRLSMTFEKGGKMIFTLIEDGELESENGKYELSTRDGKQYLTLTLGEDGKTDDMFVIEITTLTDTKMVGEFSDSDEDGGYKHIWTLKK